jgi:hypothetical protein
VYDEFNGPPISTGRGSSRTEFFVDGNHTKVNEYDIAVGRFVILQPVLGSWHSHRGSGVEVRVLFTYAFFVDCRSIKLDIVHCLKYGRNDSSGVNYSLK